MPMLTVYGLISKMDNNDKMKQTVLYIFNQMAQMRKLEVVQRKTVGEWLWGAKSTILEELMKNIAMLPADMKGNRLLSYVKGYNQFNCRARGAVMLKRGTDIH